MTSWRDILVLATACALSGGMSGCLQRTDAPQRLMSVRCYSGGKLVVSVPRAAEVYSSGREGTSWVELGTGKSRRSTADCVVAELPQ